MTGHRSDRQPPLGTDLGITDFFQRVVQPIFRGPRLKPDQGWNADIQFVEFAIEPSNDFADLIREGVEVGVTRGKLLKGRADARYQRVTFGAHIEPPKAISSLVCFEVAPVSTGAGRTFTRAALSLPLKPGGMQSWKVGGFGQKLGRLPGFKSCLCFAGTVPPSGHIATRCKARRVTRRFAGWRRGCDRPG